MGCFQLTKNPRCFGGALEPKKNVIHLGSPTINQATLFFFKALEDGSPKVMEVDRSGFPFKNWVIFGFNMLIKSQWFRFGGFNQITTIFGR